jgi:transcriptional activator SPT7
MSYPYHSHLTNMRRADKQEMILHALYENGGLAPADIEAHIKDDIEKEQVKLVDMDKKMRQAYKDIVSLSSFNSTMLTPRLLHPS